MHQRRGARRGARQSRAEGARARESGAWRSGGREAGEPPTHPASPMGLRNCIGGEEVAATFRDTEDFSPRALCLCRYAPPAPYSPFFFFACLYLSVKKNVGTKRRPQDVRFTELLIGGKKKSFGCKKKYHHIERKEYAICCISRKSIVPVMSIGLICLQTENKFAYVQIFL